MLKTPCIGCGRAIPASGHGRCPACRPAARRYRDSRQWRQLREQVRAAGICAVCGRSDVPLEVHHVDQLSVDLAAGVAGELVALCSRCHHDQHAAVRR